MTGVPTTARTRADACPGVLSPHPAADGALARVRLPGGVVSASALRAVAELAAEAGDGAVHLTSRGNLQLRGLDPADPRPLERLGAAGLLPSWTHERVRNVLASPLSGIAGGAADVRGLAAALDGGLCARPALAALPGRFLFAFDDGRGDVAAERPDVCWLAVGDDGGELLVAGTGTGVRCAPADAPGLLLDAAEAFLGLRAGHADDPDARAWRAAELPDAARRIAGALPGRSDRESRSGAPDRHAVTPDPRPATRTPRPSGPEGADVAVDPGSPSAAGGVPPSGAGPARAAVGPLGGGAVGAAPVLGELSVTQLHVLAGLAPELLVTPWRTLVLPAPHAPATVLARLRDAALVVDPHDPAPQVGACAGTPGCAKSLADVRTHARSLIASGPGGPVHVSGCARRCGAPHGPHTGLVATGPQTYTTEEHR